MHFISFRYLHSSDIRNPLINGPIIIVTIITIIIVTIITIIIVTIIIVTIITIIIILYNLQQGIEIHLNVAITVRL